MPEGRGLSISVMLWLQSVILITVLFAIPVTYWIAFQSGIREGKNQVYETCVVTPRACQPFSGHIGPNLPVQR